MLVDKDCWLMRASAGRRTIMGRPMRRRPSGSRRGCTGVGPALWSLVAAPSSPRRVAVRRR